MTLKQSQPSTSVTLNSRLFLADLGGSEQVRAFALYILVFYWVSFFLCPCFIFLTCCFVFRHAQVKKSGVEAGHTREGQTEDFSLGFEMGQHMREAVNINLGLLALKKCIEGAFCEIDRIADLKFNFPTMRAPLLTKCNYY